MTEVIIYSTPTCSYCKMIKEYLRENKIEYKDYNVASDGEKAQEMMDKSGQMGVPVIIIKKDNKENVLVGFDQNKLDKIFKK